jgi:hypothetical protein
LPREKQTNKKHEAQNNHESKNGNKYQARHNKISNTNKQIEEQNT